MTDSYLTITAPCKGEYSEKRSKFIAFAFHVENTDEVKQWVGQYEREYYDARHVCYAYVLGHQRDQFRAVDNGEPSGTAGKPILGIRQSEASLLQSRLEQIRGVTVETV